MALSMPLRVQRLTHVKQAVRSLLLAARCCCLRNRCIPLRTNNVEAKYFIHAKYVVKNISLIVTWCSTKYLCTVRSLCARARGLIHANYAARNFHTFHTLCGTRRLIPLGMQAIGTNCATYVAGDFFSLATWAGTRNSCMPTRVASQASSLICADSASRAFPLLHSSPCTRNQCMAIRRTQGPSRVKCVVGGFVLFIAC